MYGSRMRLTRKPAQSLTTIAVLPQRRARLATSATASSDERGPATTSTSGMRLTGLKKCMPTKRSGCASDSAMAATESDEVLLASTQSSRTWRSTSASTLRFTPRSSTTASTTTSAAAKPVKSMLPPMRSRRCAACWWVSLRILTSVALYSLAVL